MSTASQYLYEHVSRSTLMEDMRFGHDAPAPGDHLPSFDLPSDEGGRIGSEELLARGPVLLVTGSYTCPMTASSNPHLKELHSEYGDVIQFVMVHVREAHPGEHHDQTRTLEDKIEQARALRARDDLPWPIAVDDPEGTLHRRLDEKPNAVYLADETGKIVYRALWAGDTRGLEQALDSVAHGEKPRYSESRRRLGPMAMGVGKMREMTRAAGPRAETDLWRVAPPMAGMAWLADQYRPLPPQRRTITALATIGLVGAFAVYAVRRSLRG